MCPVSTLPLPLSSIKENKPVAIALCLLSLTVPCVRAQTVGATEMVISVSDVLRFTAPTHTEHVVAESATTRKDALQVTEQVTVLSNYPVNVTLTPVSAGVFAHYVPADDDAQTDLAVEVPFSDAPSPTDQPATARPNYAAPATSDADKANVLILTAVAR